MAMWKLIVDGGVDLEKCADGAGSADWEGVYGFRLPRDHLFLEHCAVDSGVDPGEFGFGKQPRCVRETRAMC